MGKKESEQLMETSQCSSCGNLLVLYNCGVNHKLSMLLARYNLLRYLKYKSTMSCLIKVSFKLYYVLFERNQTSTTKYIVNTEVIFHAEQNNSVAEAVDILQLDLGRQQATFLEVVETAEHSCKKHREGLQIDLIQKIGLIQNHLFVLL